MTQPIRADSHNYRRGEDTAAYLVDPGTVKAPGRHSPGNMAHARPYLVSGNDFFVFPIGMEGFRRSGTAGISIHKYLGEVAADVHVFHREEGRIEISGTFPGTSAQDAMVACLSILRSKPSAPGLLLYAPGVFEREQYVVAETWDFTHSADDRSHSIDYSITLVRSGEGRAVVDPRGVLPPANPTVSKRKRGKPARFFTVVDGARTLKQISYMVYRDANKWRQIVALNAGELGSFQRSDALNTLNNLPSYQIATYRWPVGTRFRY